MGSVELVSVWQTNFCSYFKFGISLLGVASRGEKGKLPKQYVGGMKKAVGSVP